MWTFFKNQKSIGKKENCFIILIVKGISLTVTFIGREVREMSSFIDEDELECEFCGHIGMILAGDWDVECPVCDACYSLLEEDSEEE